MPKYSDRASALAEVISGVEGSGLVFNRTRAAKNWAEFVDRFAVAGRIAGWQVSRTSAVPDGHRWVETYSLLHLRGLVDAEESELDFQEHVDQVAARFVPDVELPHGMAVTDGLAAPVLTERHFQGVLVHVAECELKVAFPLLLLGTP